MQYHSARSAALLYTLALAALTGGVHQTLQAQSGVAHPTTASTAQEYTILIFESAAQLATRTSPTARDAYWDAYDRFAGELAQAGVLRGGSALDEAQASTVRGTGGTDRAVRGARLGGYFVISAPDLATAEQWARKAPPLALAVEVRPHRANPHMSRAK